jgi:hypothetical protein
VTPDEVNAATEIEWHVARPRTGTEQYPHGYEEASGEPPDWVDAECAVCGEAVEWDRRNLWAHSEGGPT